MIAIPGFEDSRVEMDGQSLFVSVGGSGSPVLLLHGFPQTHLMWRGIAPILADRFTVVCADLPGYGRSSCPEPAEDHRPHSKRVMASTCRGAMDALGFESFHIVGHDRGGRVAFRMGMDHPDGVRSVGVLDVIPTLAAWDRADARLALSFWPWSLLAQPAPLPERLLSADPAAVVDDALANWGTPSSTFPADVRGAYVEALCDPATVQAICEEYRAAAGIDRDHDAADRDRGRRLRCPLLALWSGSGGLATWYEAEGGPLTIWREWADDVSGDAVPGGHFFPEEAPAQVAQKIEAFLARVG